MNPTISRSGYFFAIVFLLVTNSVTLFAQGKVLADAERYYGIRNYEQALPLFEQVISEGSKDPMVHYKAGVCLQKSPILSEQIKAIR